MEKKLTVEVIREVRNAAREVVKMIAEAELAIKSEDERTMKTALETVIEKKSSVLLRLAVVTGTLEGNLCNRGLIKKMWDSLKG